MVRALITIGSLLTAAHGVAGGTSITLNQGANISVTAPAAADAVAFDLAGQLWLRRDANENAVPLTESGLFNQRPAFSRNGRLVAYQSLRAGYRQIFVTDIEAGVDRQVTFGPYDHLAPAWSTANSARPRLAMASNRGGTFDIWEVDIGNLELHQLTFTAADEHDPAWDDDGSHLAYVAESTSGSSLYVLEPGGKPRRVLHEAERIVAPAWRPGGGVLTYTRISAASSQLRMLILSTPPITKAITQHEHVSPRPVHWLDRQDFLYTSDGKIRRRTFGLSTYDNIPFSITVEIDRDRDHDGRSTRASAFQDGGNRPVRGIRGRTSRADGRTIVAALGDLWEFRYAGNDKLTLVRQLTNDAFVDAQPAFSPDGQHVAFVSDRGGRPQIWIMDHASLDLRRLTREAALIGAPAWNPDGSAVAYVVHDDDSGFGLRLADVANGQSQALTATSRNRGTPVLEDDEWIIRDDKSAGSDALANEGAPPVPLSWRPTVGAERYIVRAGRIFDGIGPEYLLRQEIVIERDRIVAIRPWSDDNPDMLVVDATAQTVIPGLIDLDVQQEPVDSERIGRKWLAAGVTTIRQTVGDFDLAIERFESWSSGRRIGPRLMMTIRPCDGTSGRFDADLFDRVLANATMLNVVAIELCPDLSGEPLTGVINRAHEHGLSVIATSPTPDGILGVDELRPHQDSAVWRTMLLVNGPTGAAIPSRIVTAATPRNRILDGLTGSWQYRKIFLSDERRRFNTTWLSHRTPDALAATIDVNRILGAGGRIALGSEAPTTPQGLGLQGEMRLLAAASVQPFQVLKIAGLDAARVLGTGESLGLIRIGRQADLVILDGDPLTDIGAIVNVVGTIVNGRHYSRRSLTTPGLRGLGVGKLYNSARR